VVPYALLGDQRAAIDMAMSPNPCLLAPQLPWRMLTMLLYKMGDDWVSVYITAFKKENQIYMILEN
jgi:hypothetical protein